MLRLVRGRNSLRPVIDGRLLPGRNGVRIEVQLKLHALVVVLCALLVLVGGSVTVLVASELVAIREAPQVWFVIWMGVVSCVFLVVTVLEARKATRLLSELFKAEPAGQQRRRSLVENSENPNSQLPIPKTSCSLSRSFGSW
jgi:hypothetical protein